MELLQTRYHQGFYLQRYSLLCLLLLMSAFLSAQSSYKFTYDKTSSAITGAENLISLHNIIYDFEGKYLKTKYWEEDTFLKKAGGISYRLAKTILLDFQFDYLAHIYQHEVFGHGYRYREFEYEDNSYNINLAPPYDVGGGFARRGTTTYPRRLGFHEEIIIRSGGMEAAAVLSQSLARKWMRRGNIHYRESLVYLYTFGNYVNYIDFTKNGERELPGNDVINYIRTLHSADGITNPNFYRLTVDDLFQRSSINYLNSNQFFALYTFLKVYLLCGEESLVYPMIDVGNIKYLPSVRFGLSSFGSEFIIENYFKTANTIWSVDLRLGDNKLHNFYGAGIAYYRNHSANLGFELGIDVWEQPSMQLGGENLFDTKAGLGGRFLTELEFYPKTSFPVGLYAQTGYKSQGYIEGERLDKGLILRIGLAFRAVDKGIEETP